MYKQNAWLAVYTPNTYALVRVPTLLPTVESTNRSYGTEGEPTHPRPTISNPSLENNGNLGKNMNTTS